jgi:hypothetical protein
MFFKAVLPISGGKGGELFRVFGLSSEDVGGYSRGRGAGHGRGSPRGDPRILLTEFFPIQSDDSFSSFTLCRLLISISLCIIRTQLYTPS